MRRREKRAGAVSISLWLVKDRCQQRQRWVFSAIPTVPAMPGYPASLEDQESPGYRTTEGSARQPSTLSFSLEAFYSCRCRESESDRMDLGAEDKKRSTIYRTALRPENPRKDG